MTVPVAIDIGPLSARRTGIGHAVAALVDELERHDDVRLLPYVTSFRHRSGSTTRRLPLPAAVAHRLWARLDHPRVDRWLAPARIVHGTNYVVPPSRMPRLVSVYDCWFLRNPGQAHADVDRMADVLRRAVATGADIHTTSTASADILAELFPTATVHVVPLAPIPLPRPPERAPVAELDGRPFVLSVATLERRKNIPALVEAFGLLSATHPDVRLVLAGSDGDDRAAIDGAIDRLPRQVAARVLLTGYATDDVRSWLLHHATVLAYPSLDEGFGLPLLDAMQAGIPIVASTAGSIPEVAGDAAVYAAPHDTPALAERLTAALGDTTLRERLLQAGGRQLDRYSWPTTATGLVAVYRRLVGADESR